MLTTREYFDILVEKHEKLGGNLILDKVSFDPVLFVELVNRSDKFEILNSHDGPISTIQEYEGVSRTDFSKLSTEFDIHQDALYYTDPPQFEILYCENHGLRKATTEFYNGERLAKAIIDEGFEGLDYVYMNYIGREGQVYQHKLIRTNPSTGNPCVMFANRGYPSQDPNNIDKIPLMRELSKLTSFMFERMDTYYRETDIIFENNDLMLLDNWKYPHRRKSNILDRVRKLFRIYLNRK